MAICEKCGKHLSDELALTGLVCQPCREEGWNTHIVFLQISKYNREFVKSFKTFAQAEKFARTNQRYRILTLQPGDWF